MWPKGYEKYEGCLHEDERRQCCASVRNDQETLVEMLFSSATGAARTDIQCLFSWYFCRYNTEPAGIASGDDQDGSRPMKAYGSERHHSQPITAQENEESDTEASPRASIADR